MSAFRSTLPRRFPRHANSPFHAPPPAALEGRQAERLAFLLDRPFAKPRISDPPLPPAPYPSPLDAPLRPGRKPQRSAWLGPEDEAVAQPEIVWAVNPAHARASEAEGRVPSDWFVRRVDRTGFLPVYTERVKGGTNTIIRKVEGDSTTLLHALLAHLATVPPRPPRFAPADAPAPTPSRKGALGRVNPVNKHLEIRGSWQQATRAWLVEQGM